MRLIHCVTAFFACTSIAITSIATTATMPTEKIAFCTGEIEGGHRIEVNLFREPKARLIGTVVREGRLTQSMGLALRLATVDNEPLTRSGFVEYKLESDLNFAADTSGYYTMFLYADKNSGELRGQHFIHLYRKGRLPLASFLECAGTISLP